MGEGAEFWGEEWAERPTQRSGVWEEEEEENRHRSKYRNRAAPAMGVCGVEERRGKNIRAIKSKETKGHRESNGAKGDVSEEKK